MDTREKIIRLAGALFLQTGIKKIKTDTLARKLKISKRTIYFHFKNKDELISSTIEVIRTDQKNISQKILEDSENAIDAVLGLMKNITEMVSGINPDYISDIKRLYPKLWQENLKKGKTDSYNFILQLIKQGKKEGLCRETPNERIIAFILTEQLYMIVDQKLLPPEEFSVPELIGNIILTMTSGVVTDKGLKMLNAAVRL